MNRELEQLGEEYLTARMSAFPFMATMFGVPGYDHAVPDLSVEHGQALTHRLESIAARTAALDPDVLDEEERISRDMLAHECAAGVASVRSRSVEYTAGGLASPLALMLAYVPKVVLATRSQAADYAERCRGLGRYLDQAAERLRIGAREGRTATRQGVQRGLAQIDACLAGDPAADVLFAPLTSTGPGERADLDLGRCRDEVLRAVREQIRPAVARLRAVIADTVAPLARPDDRCGIGYLPGGEAIYTDAIRANTTTDLTAGQIHDLGLQVCEQLRAEYATLAAGPLGTDDFSSILARLREDPELRYTSSEQILGHARQALRRAEQALPLWFRHTPRAACTVEEMSALESPDAVLGYYQPPAVDGSRPGRHWVNSSNPIRQSRYDTEARAFHESIPGHHLQLAAAQEMTSLPAFRRSANIPAYVEGWGLYSERLADEMGLYFSDLDRLGMLSNDSWRACRLVVDTGMHAFGWSRQRAIEFMRANTALQEANISNEVDRYISLPGQALGYMVGRVEIMRLRDRARQRLGAGYDPRDFHDVVLDSGTIPLPTLSAKVDRWLAVRVPA